MLAAEIAGAVEDLSLPSPVRVRSTFAPFERSTLRA